MVMNFWESQRKAKAWTTFYLFTFITLTLGVAILVEIALRYFTEGDYNPDFPIIGGAFLLITFLVAGYNYLMYRTQGGGYVAESMGGWQVDSRSGDPRERQLYNIVQEMAIATTLPAPKVYVVPANEINAFAAGLTKSNAAIAVTQGTLQRLSRDELQGVIAHEFGHIYNGDMVISLRLAAMVMGFFFVLYLGFRLLESMRFRDRDNKGKNSAALIALIFIAAGALTWFVGSILKASVSRQREYLADACAVQFTRNPSGLANALRKIAKEVSTDMPKTGSAYSHMYLEDHTSIFSTHPSIKKRIEAIEGGKYSQDIT